MRPLFAALQFLTILPIPGQYAEKDLSRSVCFFPIVGLLIGLITAGFDIAAQRLMPPSILAILTTALLAAITGGLHLDGLADTADGFMSARPKERVLEIMRDSRIGTMGVLALLLILALKTTAILQLNGISRAYALLLAPCAGRCMQVATMQVLPYARQNQGLAAVFVQHRGIWLAAYAGLFLGVLAYALQRTHGLIATASAITVTLLLGLWSKRRIDGFTGDTLGCTSECAETTILCVFAALSP